MTDLLTILEGDCIARLRELPEASVHCVVTSPPYWGLRNYGHPGQIGQEKTPADYVASIVGVFAEVWRVLRDDGTVWLNLGDSYAANGGHSDKAVNDRRGRLKITERPEHEYRALRARGGGLKPKDLCMIPARSAIALQEFGWYLRSEITWCKRVPMPESVQDRPTSATEKIFLLTKNRKYFYDAVAVRNPPSESWANDSRWKTGSTPDNEKDGYTAAGAQNPKQLHRMFDKQRGHSRRHAGFNDRWDQMPKEQQMANGSNMRNFWVLSPEPYPDSHFATFPTEVPRRCILAGTSAAGCCANCGAPRVRVVSKSRQFQSGSGRSGNSPNGKNGHKLQGGGETGDIRRGPVVTSETTGWKPTCGCGFSTSPCVVLDPFGGSGTTGQVALELGRRAILIELNPDYIKLIRQRCNVTPGLALA